MEKTTKILLGLAIKHNGNWSSIYHDLQQKDYEGAEALAEAYTGSFITILDEEYPDYLKQVSKPPFMLFYNGDISLLKKEHTRVCVSTSRATDEDSLSFLHSLINNDYNDIDYVINETTHNIKIDRKKHHVICVAGCGLELVNCTNYDLTISEIPNGTTKTSEGMLGAYRIMAGISSKIMVGKVKRLSGTNALISFGLHQNKDILVMPVKPKENIEEDLGNNKLIYDGAIPLVDKEQLAFYLGH